MKRLVLALLLLAAASADAGTFRIHYSGRDVTVLAETSSEARRTVMDMFGPNCVVTGVRRIK